ncbi:MAG: sensor histidine kinase [Sarcina sp.]
MNNLKRNVIYQYILVSIVLVITSVYLWKVSNWICLDIFHSKLTNDFVKSTCIFILEITLFFLCAYWYDNRISKYIKEEAQRQVKEQNQLFANIAHDLKSPMTTVIGLSRALEEGVASDIEKNEITHIITEKSKHMDKIINLMFEYAKMESASYQLNKSNVDIVRLVKEFVAHRYSEFEKKNMELNLNLPIDKIIISIDKLQISRVIDNLINNVIFHNQDGIKVEIGVEESADRIKVWIADSGVEIEKELEDKIFNPFVCAEKSRNSKNGSGLGLAIAKKVIEMHAGEIFIEKHVKGYKKSFAFFLIKEEMN